MSIMRAHVFVSGRVQGVGFRWSTEMAARGGGLYGWVRNRRDGRVEAVFEGDEVAVGRAVEWCREGPPGARVEEVEVSWETPEGETEFTIEPTT